MLRIHNTRMVTRLSGLLALQYRAMYSESKTRPPLEEVLPKKNTLRNYLFQHKVPLSYADVMKTYQSCYDDTSVPKKVTGQDLLSLQKILASHRKQTRTISPHGLALEHSVLETAAEMGNHMAIATLAGEILTATAKYEQAKASGNLDSAVDLEYSPEDIEHAQKLLMELSKNEFPLALKISGDVAFLVGKVDKAAELYSKCAELLAGDSSAVAASTQAECFRGIGIVAFQNYELAEARLAFDNCISMGGAKDHPDVHFYLGQMASEVSDYPRARFHYREAASKGFFDSFAPLGNLELYYFDDVTMAGHWFGLGAEMNEPSCLAGLFDVSMRKKEYSKAEGYKERIFAGNAEFVRSFKQSRDDLLKELEVYEKKQSEQNKEMTGGDLWK